MSKPISIMSHSDLIELSHKNAHRYEVEAAEHQARANECVRAARLARAEANMQAAAAVLSDGWRWFAGDNDEMYRTGPCLSRDEAIAAAIREGTGQEYADGPIQYTIHIIEARQDPIDLSSWIDVDAMIESMHESLGNDIGGEDGESPAENAWDDAQQADLEAAIKAAVAGWQARHAIVIAPRQFTDSRNAERISIPETTKTDAASDPMVRRMLVDEVDQWSEDWKPCSVPTVSAE